MKYQTKALPDFLTESSQIKEEISITGKWASKKKSDFFNKSTETKGMIKEWNDIHTSARNHEGILSTEINHAIGQDAVLVHHIFETEESLGDYFDTVATEHFEPLTEVANADLHIVRGLKISENTITSLRKKKINAAFGEYQFGYVKNDYERPDPKTAIQVTANWTSKEGEDVGSLLHLWQMVGTEAFTLEKGLIRFEVYKVIGENALIIHETFEDTNTLQFHLSKGTAHKYKKEIDEVAFPEAYFFRGPVSWQIRTYSKFLNLPATYTRLGMNYITSEGSLSEGIIQKLNIKEMTNQEITVVYKWTANPGKLEDLKAIYQSVEKQMEETEPNALKVDCYVDESTNTLIVYDLFKDGAALGQHLGTTAAGHFPQLLEIAQPGPFLFCGSVPEDLQKAAIGMGLDATFAPRSFGFKR